MTAGDSIKLPADFPKDVFLYKGAVLNTSMELRQGFNLVFQVKDDTSKVSETYLVSCLRSCLNIKVPITD